MLPAVVLVRDDPPIRIGGGAHFSHVRRAVVIPPVFVPAHELHANGFANRLRQNRGCLRHVIVTTVPVCSRSFVVLHANFLRGYSEQASHAVARSVHILRRADDPRGIRRHVG